MTKEQLIEQLKAQNIRFDEKRIDLLFAFMDETLATNEKFNLTAITDREEFIEKMLFDSALAFTAFDFSNKKAIDVGTGAGYPGMVLKILEPTIDITMLDSTSKKIDFIKCFTSKHNVNVNTFAGRAEEYSKENREQYDVATARAVASLPILLEIIAPLLKVNGTFLALKGPSYEEEIKLSQNALKKLDLVIDKTITFKLPCSHELRSIICIRKFNPTNRKYPREYSDIKRRPL